MDGRFSISLHILTLLAHAGTDWLSSDFMAGSIAINPVLVRKELSNLRKHGLVVSKEGKNGGSTLAKPPNQIPLSAVYQAVQRNSLLGTPRNSPNPACRIGKQINQHLDKLHQQAEAAVLQQLGSQTLAEFCQQFV